MRGVVSSRGAWRFGFGLARMRGAIDRQSKTYLAPESLAGFKKKSHPRRLETRTTVLMAQRPGLAISAESVLEQEALQRKSWPVKYTTRISFGGRVRVRSCRRHKKASVRVERGRGVVSRLLSEETLFSQIIFYIIHIIRI